MKAWRIVVLALAALLVGTARAGEDWHRPFVVLGPDQGLPNGGIMCMAQDSDGFIWLGTQNGLLRYESGQCSRWTRNEGLPSESVDQLLAIPGGGLWISTAQGLARLRQGHIEAISFQELNAFPGIRGMAMDPSGHVWVATGKGLFVQTGDREFRLHPYAFPGEVLTVSRGDAGTMHVGTDRGLFSFHADGGTESWTATQGLPKEGAGLIGEDAVGRLWVYTGRTLVMKEPGAAAFKDHSRLLNAAVTPYGVFLRDQDGTLWLPTRKGAVHLNGSQAVLLDATAGLPMRWVRNVFRDREGGFWILGATLARLLGDERLWYHPLTTGPSGEIVWAMLRDAHGELLVGTDDGVMRMGPAGPKRIPGTEGHRVKSLALDRSGVLWMVGTLGPALWLEPGSERARVAPLGERGVGLNTVMADQAGQIRIGHASQGILRWDAGQRRLVQEVGTSPKQPGYLCAFQIRQDGSGRMWAATSAGLHVRDTSGTWRLYTEKEGLPAFGLHGLAFLPDGSAWIHSREPLGLHRIRLEGSQVKVLDHRSAGQGLRSNVIYAVDVDSQGRTWATTDQGFDCIDTNLHVGRQDGMVSEDCDLLALLIEKQHIWVGTSAGLVRYEPRSNETHASAPMPYILHVMKGDQRLEAPLETFAPVGPRESSLAFRVAVPSYRNEGQMRIQVRLAGLEEGWRDLDAPLTRYPALPGGTYRFEARAALPGGEFGHVVGLNFKVLPPWWRTWWALTLWGLGALGLVLLIIRLRVASLAESKAALEHLVAERTEELSGRNAELTDALGRVKQLSGLLPICASCKKIRDDKGYWNQLEHYISEHSEVGFSHGICPDCIGTLYPGRAARQANKAADSKP
ncbi:hypothetical protein GETHLI_07920 [Geothrix limicola]|uniref:Two component regulator three Y domain-containing protein n=1 Tax=Geothrix limicola TaxID=2927978 RepID=A0ABQ5QDS3_9BACT|nr:two-component regulator propeller domain-containing protein [Geothrix limicola]GLH72290.1 hypothetical protein GETHLI_07920 [Geothrix limicola]